MGVLEQGSPGETALLTSTAVATLRSFNGKVAPKKAISLLCLKNVGYF